MPGPSPPRGSGDRPRLGLDARLRRRGNAARGAWPCTGGTWLPRPAESSGSPDRRPRPSRTRSGRPAFEPGSDLGSSASRPRREDAARNRDQILAAARNLFAQYGSEVQLPEVARAAGVGIGTVYRHFSTRSDLIEARGHRSCPSLTWQRTARPGTGTPRRDSGRSQYRGSPLPTHRRRQTVVSDAPDHTAQGEAEGK